MSGSSRAVWRPRKQSAAPLLIMALILVAPLASAETALGVEWTNYPVATGMTFVDMEVAETYALLLYLQGDDLFAVTVADDGITGTPVLVHGDTQLNAQLVHMGGDTFGVAYNDDIDGDHYFTKTTDGGATWSNRTNIGTRNPNSDIYINANYLWLSVFPAVGGDGATKPAYYSEDEGATWTGTAVGNCANENGNLGFGRNHVSAFLPQTSSQFFTAGIRLVSPDQNELYTIRSEDGCVTPVGSTENYVSTNLDLTPGYGLVSFSNGFLALIAPGGDSSPGIYRITPTGQATQVFVINDTATGVGVPGRDFSNGVRYGYAWNQDGEAYALINGAGGSIEVLADCNCATKVGYNSNVAYVVEVNATNDLSVWISDSVPVPSTTTTPGFNPGNDPSNPLGAAKQFFEDSWGMDEQVANWLFAMAITGLIILGFARYGNNPLIIAIALLLALGLCIALGYLEIWVLFIFAFMIMAIAGTRVFSSGDDE